MQVKNKKQSDYLIKSLQLNRMSEGIFTCNQEEELKKFLKENLHPYYNIRDKNASMGEFRYKITAEEVLKYANSYQLFSVYESLADADQNHMLLQGEIRVDSNWNVKASLDDRRCISNREAMKQPKFNIFFNILESSEPHICGLKQILDYIIVNQLFDVIVEFTLYDVPVGVKKENIIIWELRNY